MGIRGRFELHLPGLLKVLAEHLYSTQRVGVRELIQNAHDSCVRLAVERPDPRYRPRIDLSIDAASRTLRVTDNGSGLTEQGILSYLTVFGRGYTRELRDRLEAEESRRVARVDRPVRHRLSFRLPDRLGRDGRHAIGGRGRRCGGIRPATSITI